MFAKRKVENGFKQALVYGSTRRKSSLVVGEKFSVKRMFSEEDINQFVLLTEDRNPIHVDKYSANQLGHQSILVPGMLIASLFPAIVGCNFPGAIYASQSLKFRSALYANQEVIAEVEITKKSSSRIQFCTRCRRLDRVVIVDGQAMAIIKQPPN
eukprot:TRINITY_DN11042_c1_g2_i1.p2 TRINITY_DN11042_c1_g2~~TRINITY_DN11042_c1_g2_i1.p2  ORF type:complete len:155 (-),score=13.84 TRINITY_DN11042_c1_g2_i1:160-624(-)